MESEPHQLRHNQNHFPPSPPPSPPPTRRRPKKKLPKDPFLQLGDPSNYRLNELPPSSPPKEAEVPDEPLYKRLIVTPFLFVSFLVSLFLVDTRNAVARTKNTTLFGLLDPEPYQDPQDSTWDRRGSTTHVQPPDSLNPDRRAGKEKRKRRSWHLHKKIRMIAKLEISDAFEMRKRVMVAMVATAVVVLYAVWCFFKWTLNMV